MFVSQPDTFLTSSSPRSFLTDGGVCIVCREGPYRTPVHSAFSSSVMGPLSSGHLSLPFLFSWGDRTKGRRYSGSVSYPTETWIKQGFIHERVSPKTTTTTTTTKKIKFKTLTCLFKSLRILRVLKQWKYCKSVPE